MTEKKEYIEREALIQRLAVSPLLSQMRASCFLKEGVLDIIQKFPAADVAPVKHGEWKIGSEIHRMMDDYDEELYVECPFCKRTFYVPFEFEDTKIIEYARENYPYCHCGAKMDGERKE